MKKNVWKSMGVALALACGMILVSCGDDDPITPVTPDPDPVEPQPAKTYYGYAFTLKIDTLLGEEEAVAAFQAIIKEQVAATGVTFNEVEVAGPGMGYSLKMTYNMEDETETKNGKETMTKCQDLVLTLLDLNNKLITPVVTGVWTSTEGYASGVDKEWQSGFAPTSSESDGGISIPLLDQTTWKAVQAPEGSDIETLYFGIFLPSDKIFGTLEAGKFKLNGVEQEGWRLSRRGNLVNAADSEGKTVYGFHIPEDGKQIVLTQLNGEDLAQEKQIVFEPME